VLTTFFTSYLGKLILTAGVAALPVLELRGAIPFGLSLGLSAQAAFLSSLIGNMIPVAFIILLIRRVFTWLHNHPQWGPVVNRLEERAHLQSRLVRKYRLWGLCLLVAIPLPGTGAWTGAMVAGVLEIRLRDALPVIFLGVLLAGIIVLLASYGVITLLWG